MSTDYTQQNPYFRASNQQILHLRGVTRCYYIGEQDCQDIKEIFGRGQGFGQWNNSRLEKDKQELKSLGFEIVFTQNYFYNEYYSSYEDLDLFLQGVPIFEDFDSKKDKKYLEKYVSKFMTEKGIKFPRQREVLVAKKPNK